MSHRASSLWSRSLVVAALLSFSAACGDDDGSRVDAGTDAGDPIDAGQLPDDDASIEDAGESDAGQSDAGAVDGGTADAAVGGLVAVSHPRELRAMWVATVSRLDFPSALGLTEAEARDELTTIADQARASGLNALFFQVRPESDALYRSSLEPWSRFLTGTQGTDPGWDPLGLLIEIAHARGLEVHAWLNPYRGLTSTSVVAAPNHVTRRFPEAAITYNNAVVMNPADPAVRAHVVAVVAEIVREYDVDGVVFDDYFYPYRDAANTPFPDGASYDAYVADGGVLGPGDWRRDNVNQLIAAVSAAIKAESPWVMWGVSPFGIYRPGMPPGIMGTDAYEALAADSLRWMSEGWVDYLMPQLYWATTSSGQPFGPLVSWWSDHATPGRFVHPALALHRIEAFGTAELEAQVALTRAEAPQAAGHSWFRYRFLAADAFGEQAMFARIYDGPARPPPVIETAGEAVEPPGVVLAARNATLSHPHRDTIRGYAVYREVSGGHQLERWVPASTTVVTLPPGRHAISAIARGGAESQGVLVIVP